MALLPTLGEYAPKSVRHVVGSPGTAPDRLGIGERDIGQSGPGSETNQAVE